MKKIAKFVLLTGLIFILFSCKKEKSNIIIGGLGGETNIPLTQVGNVSKIYVDGSLTPATLVVAANDNGLVSYILTYDFTGRPDSVAILALVPPKYKDAQNRVNLIFHLYITSEGFQDANKPFILVKYDSSVGDVYSYTNPDGQTLTRTVTEKTGVDDWYWGGMLIKTIAVEQTIFPPTSAAVVNKMTFRANHRFGLVYLEAVFKNGSTLKMDIAPQFSL